MNRECLASQLQSPLLPSALETQAQRNDGMFPINIILLLRTGHLSALGWHLCGWRAASPPLCKGTLTDSHVYNVEAFDYEGLKNAIARAMEVEAKPLVLP